MRTAARILLVDDDRQTRELLSRFLGKNGVDVPGNAGAMKRVLEQTRIHHRIMPGEDGLTLCPDFRTQDRVPLMLLTLLGAETERILGLEMGADDCLVNPFSPHELLAGVMAVLSPHLPC